LNLIGDREEKLSNIFQQIQSNHKVLVISHENPDIDAISSVISIFLFLKLKGVDNITLLRSGPTPTSIDFLAKDNPLSDTWQDGFTPEYIFILDCEKVSRTGDFFKTKIMEHRNKATIVNIDHHKTNSFFGDINIIDDKSSSTCEILAQYLLDDNADNDLATALLAGIVSDTGRFRYSNTTEKTLQIVSKLVSLGADLFIINENIERNLLLEGILLWGEIMSHARESANKKVIWSNVTAEQYTKTQNVQEVVGSDLINQLMRSRFADLAILFVEQGDGNVRVSLRSRPPIDSSIVAKAFKGGGHVQASGCKINGTLDEAEKAILRFVNENYSNLEA